MNSSETIIVDADAQTYVEEIDRPFTDSAAGEQVEYVDDVVLVEGDDDNVGADPDSGGRNALEGNTQLEGRIADAPVPPTQAAPSTTGSLVVDAAGASDDQEADRAKESDETDYSDWRTSDDQQTELDEEEEDDYFDGLPVIRLTGGKLPQILTRAQGLLRETGVFFSVGNQIVNVVKDRTTGEATIVPTSKAKLSVVLSGAAAWLMPSGKTGGPRRVDAPDSYCAKLLQLEQFDELQPLAGLAHQPFLRHDGSLCRDTGYDATTALYGAFTASAFPLRESPTRADAEAALARLDGLLTEFPFAAAYDRSAALAAMITAAVRPSLAVAPMFLVTAPEAGTGKTFLCNLIAALATAKIVAPQSLARSAEEVDKMVLAALRTSPPVVLFDNLTDDVKVFQTLCSALTGERVSGRILGSSSIANVSTRSLLLASGNNVRPSRDMQRRCITISLDSRTEMPASRVFAHPDALQAALRGRGDLVAAALTIVRAWIGAGQPITACRPFNSYEAWSAWCRQPLLWLGRSDPAESAFMVMHEDPERQLLQSLLGEWHAAFGSSSVMVRNLIERAVLGEHKGLKDVLTDISDSGETMNRRRIGRWIAQHAGRVAGGLRLEAGRRTKNAEAWKVVPM